MADLQGKKLAVLATNDFEDSELSSPVDAVKEAWGPDRGGAVTDVAVDGTLMVSGKGGAA